MAHEISTNSVTGKVEAFYGKNTPAWHGLGTVVQGCLTSDAAIQTAGLDWNVGIWDAYAVGNNGNTMVKAKSHRMTVREDTNEVLGVIGKDYKVIQNLQAFGFVDNLIADGVMQYETAGALRGGKTVWMLATMPDRKFMLNGESSEMHESWVLFVNSHDGKGAARVIPTTVRVVCQNTLNVAMNSGSQGLRIWHNGDLEAKLTEARRVLGIIDQKFDAYKTTATSLSNRICTNGNFEKFVDALMGYDEENRDDDMIAYLRGLRNSKTNQTNSADGTWFGALQAITDYVDHHQAVKSGTKRNVVGEMRLERTVLGAGAALKGRALKLAMSMS